MRPGDPRPRKGAFDFKPTHEQSLRWALEELRDARLYLNEHVEQMPWRCDYLVQMDALIEDLEQLETSTTRPDEKPPEVKP
jgi:hypothetical protein